MSTSSPQASDAVQVTSKVPSRCTALSATGAVTAMVQTGSRPRPRMTTSPQAAVPGSMAQTSSRSAVGVKRTTTTCSSPGARR